MVLLNDTDISYESIYDRVLVRNAKEIRDGVKTPAPSRWAEQCWKWMKGDMTDSSATAASSSMLHILPVGWVQAILSPKTVWALAQQAHKKGISLRVTGCSVPVLLRGSKEHEGCYYFISESYIHGMMDGVALEKMKAREYELRDFALV